VPEAIWGDATLNVFGGNLEFQPEGFRTRFAALMEQADRRARFHGPYRPADLPRLMAGVDWTVMPSIWWENSPVVIQESFLNQRPLIVSDIGGMAEKVTDGVNGLQFRVGSAEDLADRLALALRDPDLWPRLAAAAPAPPDLVAFARQHLALYRVGDTPREPSSRPRARRPARQGAIA
jgi:glycosyltransferase involved in cell wall biosynthesis